MKKNEILPEGLHGQELVDWLETNCTSTRDDHYSRLLSPEEVSEKESAYVKESMAMDVKMEEMAVIRKSYQDEMKLHKANLKDLTKAIRRKMIEDFGAIYIFRDEENGRIIEFTPTGDLITNRRMTPEDRQNVIQFPRSTEAKAQ